MTADTLRQSEKYLAGPNGVPERSRPYYLHWVREFLAFRAAFPGQRSGLLLAAFREHIAESKQPRQADQALSAASLFLRFSKSAGIELGKSPAPSASPPQPSSTGAPVARHASAWDTIETAYLRQLRLMHRSHQTEKTYRQWVRAFRLHRSNVAPADLTDADVRAFLTYLAVDRRVAAPTQRQAFNAILFLYRHVLHREIVSLDATVRGRKSRRLPVVLTRAEVSSILDRMKPPYRLMGLVIYGGGLRLAECLSLRIQDIDVEQRVITVRSGKGDKDRRTLCGPNTPGPPPTGAGSGCFRPAACR